MTPIVAIGGSAGSIEALRLLLPLLRAEWGIAFGVVIHRQPVEEDERLTRLFGGWASMPVAKARDRMPIVPGRIVVCPANVHLTVEDERFLLTSAPRENHSRPSVDVTFRSIAEGRGSRAGGIVLSGLLDDGAAGINRLRRNGGLTISQDPTEALYDGMPRAAIEHGAEIVARVAQMPEYLGIFARARQRSGGGEASIATRPTRLSCPDCGGVLVERHEGECLSYACRVGHAFSPQTLGERKGEQVERALWTAVETLEEQADLNERAARRARERGDEHIAGRLDERARNNREQACIVRGALPAGPQAMSDAELREAAPS